jgi:hypothetical protein
MSAQNSSSGRVLMPARASSAPSLDGTGAAPTSVFDPSNIPRRQLFRQTAFKIQEMLVSLEEKNHVLSTANEALQRQLARVEDVWPFLEGEFSDEAKWGSTTHWAYPENRTGSKLSNAERARRDGAAAISAAAQALAEEAAARSDARKQAVQAKKSLKHQHQDSDADDLDARQKEPAKKTTGKSRKTANAEANIVGLGISAANVNGSHPQKRRKIEKTANSAAPTTGAMSTVFGSNAPKPKPSSPRGTPAPDGLKKRKALPTGSGQAKKRYVFLHHQVVNGSCLNLVGRQNPSRRELTRMARNGMSPSVASSPVLGTFPDPKAPARASPAPTSSAPRPASSRARQNSIQSNADSAKARPASTTVSKPNSSAQPTPEMASVAAFPRPIEDANPAKEAPSAPVKTEPVKEEPVQPESSNNPTPSTTAKKEVKADEPERKSEPTPPQNAPPTTVTTKSGRASKPSTPALASFQDAARSRPSRSAETGAKKTGHKKSGSVAQVILIQQAAADTDASSSMQGDEEEGDIDGDEPTYCYCNSVSYGEMVACDADDCKREWFHLACVGLKVAPGSKSKLPRSPRLVLSYPNDG